MSSDEIKDYWQPEAGPFLRQGTGTGPIHVEDMPQAPDDREGGCWADAIEAAAREHLWGQEVSTDPLRFQRGWPATVLLGRDQRTYRCDRVLNLFNVALEGVSPAVQLLFTQSDGIWIHSPGTYVNGNDAFEGFGGDVWLKNLHLFGPNDDQSVGIRVRRRVRMEGVFVRAFYGGIEISAGVDRDGLGMEGKSNANLSILRDVEVTGCSGWGVLTDGPDANQISFYSCNFASNGRNLIEGTLLGNQYFALHTAHPTGPEQSDVEIQGPNNNTTLFGPYVEGTGFVTLDNRSMSIGGIGGVYEGTGLHMEAGRYLGELIVRQEPLDKVGGVGEGLVLAPNNEASPDGLTHTFISMKGGGDTWRWAQSPGRGRVLQMNNAGRFRRLILTDRTTSPTIGSGHFWLPSVFLLGGSAISIGTSDGFPTEKGAAVGSIRFNTSYSHGEDTPLIYVMGENGWVAHV